MKTKLMPLAALAAAAVLSTIALTDAIWNAHVPDEPGPWVDAASHAFLARGLSLAHAGVYLLLAGALIDSGRAIDRGRVLVRVLRWTLITGYVLFAAGFGWLGIADPSGTPTGVFSIVVNLAFVSTLVVPIVLGFALIRRRDLRLPVVLLTSPVVLLPLTILLGSTTTWGHPAYLETAVSFGVALLCIAAPAEGAPVTREDRDPVRREEEVSGDAGDPPVRRVP